MKRALSLYSLSLLLLCCGVSQQADAQFWKKIFGKEEKKPAPRPKYTPRPAVSEKRNTTSGKKKPATAEPLRLAATVKKSRYRIDILTPLYLGELVSGGKPVYKSHLPDKVLPGLNFYQGTQLAADTLNTQGYHLDIYVHDITDPKETAESLLKSNKLDSADLIIGAVSSHQIAPIAAFAKKHAINFVSALSPADGGVEENLYFNLVQPTLQRHCEAVRAAVKKLARPTTNLLIYHRPNVAVDEQCFRYITADSPSAYTRVAMNTALPAEKLRNFLDSNASNVVVMPIVDVAYAKQLLEQLSKSFPTYRFEVYGMPSWKGLSLLRKEDASSNVGITIPSAFYFDPSSSAGKGFSDAYNEKYGSRPSELAYRGYELLFWYAYLLQRYGTIFNDHFGDNGVAPFTRFDMRLVTDKSGKTQYYENHHVYLYRYQGGSFNVAQ
jgi:hypothetical protein